MIKLVVIYILIIVLFVMFDMSPIINLINSVIEYITQSTIGTAITNVFKYIGNLFDLVIFNSETTVTTSGGVVLGNLVWLGTIVRIAVVFFFIKLLIKVVL